MTLLIAATLQVVTVSGCGSLRKVPPMESHEVSNASDSSIVKLIREELANADLVIEQSVVEYYPPQPDVQCPDSALAITPAVSEDNAYPIVEHPPKIRNPTPASDSQTQGAVRRTVNTKIRLQAVKSNLVDSTSVALAEENHTEDLQVEQTKETAPESNAVKILRLVATARIGHIGQIDRLLINHPFNELMRPIDCVELLGFQYWNAHLVFLWYDPLKIFKNRMSLRKLPLAPHFDPDNLISSDIARHYETICEISGDFRLVFLRHLHQQACCQQP